MAELTRRLEGTHTSLFHPFYIHYKFLMEDLTAAIQEHASGVVLDVGCGNKPYESIFPEEVTKYIGCDVEQSNLKKVDKICPATELDFAAEYFDTVFCTQVLEHVFKHGKAIQEIYRVLKKGGKFIGSVPMAWPHHEEPNDYFRFTKYGLTNLLEETGFKIVLLKPNGGKWALLGQMLVLNFTEKPPHPSLLSKIKYYLFKFTLSKVWINWLFSRLDKISSHNNYHNTLNFVFVAQK